MSTLSRTDRERLSEVGTFAAELIGEPLWPHQLDVARSRARFRTLLAGRQIGKSRVLAVIALHHAFTKANQSVLIISSGDDAAKDLLSEVVGLAQSPWLGASVEADDSTKVVLSNASVIRCVPATHRRARGKSIDLLILDEACFISEDVWDAAKFTILARPGSRVVMASTPAGRRDKFFARHYRMGEDGRDGYESWKLPSSVSPLVDQALLREWEQTDAPRVYAAEVLAEWQDEQGAYFTQDEIDAATADYELVKPDEADLEWTVQPYCGAVAGLDWGLARDANAIAVLAPLDDERLNAKELGNARVLYVPWLEARHNWAWNEFIDYLTNAAAKFPLRMMASETNGVGSPNTFELNRRVSTYTHVMPVHTDARRKESGFGMLKLLMNQGRLVLPRHKDLRRQLSGLEYEVSETGNTRIAVPDRVGHDDLLMSLVQALSCVQPEALRDVEYEHANEEQRLFRRKTLGLGNARHYAEQRIEAGLLDVVATPTGLRVPRRPVPDLTFSNWIVRPRGYENGEKW